MNRKSPVERHWIGSWIPCALCLALVACSWSSAFGCPQDQANRLDFQPLPHLPDSIGVAGPIVGVHGDVLLVAGGANFAAADDPQLWQLPKRYLSSSWLMRRDSEAETGFRWDADSGFELSQPVAYSAVVSTPMGVLVMGGEDQTGPTDRAFLLTIENDLVQELDAVIPDLPLPCTAGGAAVIGRFVYLVAGQVQRPDGTREASRLVWRLDLDEVESARAAGRELSTDHWQPLPGWPEEGPARMHCQVAAQHDGFQDRLYVIGGRRFLEGSDTSDLQNLQPTADGWSFSPADFQPAAWDAASEQYDGPSPWKRIADAPVPITAGSAVPLGPAHILLPSGTDMEVFHDVLRRGIEMENFDHPGFPRRAWIYHTLTNSWAEFGSIPANQVTTPIVQWGDDILLVSGEVRPRVRTNQVWRINVQPQSVQFGWINMSVVVVYLASMVGVGLFFARRNRSTDAYFRGGKSIPWWVAGCSIFATMLSSITYMAIPAKAFAQDWVYWVGNCMILAIAPIAIYFALPFFRRIDATSAYEYLERRFNRPARWIGSGSFSLFHVFRMGVVLALAALALASVTPLTATQCVYVMGLLSIIYCTLGGVEAVVWTDTLQTFVLLGGAVVCLLIAWMGASPGSLAAAADAGKLQLVNLDFGPASFSTMALWVVVLGAFGQNLSSYTADQAVVQRYMTTENESLAAKSIWLNGFMAVPASGLFFAMGTAFWMFYRSHPDKLDPTIAIDRIMPLFISHELPVGLAGLVVAGIFAAAQSTVSTSMNSGATTIVTDFFRPLELFRSEQSYLWAARGVTLAMGVLGTVAGLWFVDPMIKSLFDQFIGILGMFLGVLAGLFALGATTRRASGAGSLVGAAVAILTMTAIVSAANGQTWLGLDVKAGFDGLGLSIYRVSSYLYAFIGITICYVIGYAASWLLPAGGKDLSGLTLWDLRKD